MCQPVCDELAGTDAQAALHADAMLLALEEAGLEITESVSIEVPSSEPAAGYLQTKKEKMGHLLDLDTD